MTKQSYSIYVLLTDTGTLFTRMIKLFTKVPLNHASISFDRGLTEVYSFGRKQQNNPWIGGFVKENMSSKMFGQAACAVYRCTVSKTTYEQIHNHIREIEKNEHLYRYNFIGLFGVLFNKRIHRKNAYFCTQFVATVLKENGIEVSCKPPDLVTPADIEQAPTLSLVYRGCLQDYLDRHGTEPMSEYTVSA